MVTLRCTKKLFRHLGIDPLETNQPSTSRLGDWYANLIPTDAGSLIIFVNERTLLTVAVPAAYASELEAHFRDRVENLLGLLEFDPAIIEDELEQLATIEFGKTLSRRVVGSMNDMAFQYQCQAERTRDFHHDLLSLADTELSLSGMPCGPLGHGMPADVARDLLQVGTGLAS